MSEKNLLESGVPVDLLNKEARKEKKAIVPLTKMHYYHTRKPLISSRFVISGSLLNVESLTDINEFNDLLGLDPKLKRRAYTHIPNKLLQKIAKSHPEGVTILDPFAGSGMILFEALRLGLNIVALDYNAVSNLVLRGTLDYPKRFGPQIKCENKQTFFPLKSSSKKEKNQNKLFNDVQKFSNEIIEELKSDLSRFYPIHDKLKPLAYIYSWAVKCPNCGEITPLVKDWWLNKNRKIGIRYEINNNEIQYIIEKNGHIKEGNVNRAKGTCLFCTCRIENNHIVNDISENQREILLATYLENKEFVLPSDQDYEALELSKKYLKDNMNVLSKFIPTEPIADDVRSKRYLQYWYKMFNSRQLLVLTLFAKKIFDLVETLSQKNREYAAAIGTYLSMMLSNHARFNSRSTIWVNSFLAHALTTRGISMMWNHPEPNPFLKFSGSILSSQSDVLRGLDFLIKELNVTNPYKQDQSKIEIYKKSLLSWETDRKFKFIITDPPYYNDVQYPELLQFFQIWHSRTMGSLLDISPIPVTSEELSVSKNRTKEIFEKRMMVAIKKIHDLLTDDGILVMFYVHKSIDGWKYILEGLRKTGFVVTSSIALMTESKENIMTIGKSSIFHSLLFTARKRLDDKKISLLEVEEEIRKKMTERYPKLEELYGKDRMNLIVAASGIVIETITKYSEVTSFTKNTADYALEMGQRYLIEIFAKKNLDLGDVDVKTMVYTWLRHSLVDYIDYSEFNQTLKALGTGEEIVSDIITKANGKGNKIRLRDFSERGILEVNGMEPLVATSLIDAVHFALRAYMRGGITLAKDRIENSIFGEHAILNTISALANLSSTKTGYKEGKICKKFLRNWKTLQSRPQELTDWTKNDGD